MPTATVNLITDLDERIAALAEESDTIYETATARSADGAALELTEAEQARLDEIDALVEQHTTTRTAAVARAERAAAAAEARSQHRGSRVADPRPQAAPAVVRAEPRTYDRHADGSRHSFLRDVIAASPFAGSDRRGDRDAAIERLARHRLEFARDGVAIHEDATGFPAPRGMAAEGRSILTTSLGGPSSALVQPQYRPDQIVRTLTTGAPTAALCNQVPLPERGMEVTYPEVTSPTTAGAVAEAASSPTADLATTDRTIPVREIAGHVQLSAMLLDRGSGMSEPLILANLDDQIEVLANLQVLRGNGTSPNVQGILDGRTGTGSNSNNQFTEYVKAPSGSKPVVDSPSRHYQAVLLGLAAVAQARYRAADVVVMTSRRWTSISGGLDKQDRPLIQTDRATALNVIGLGDAQPSDLRMPEAVGEIGGVPVVLDEGIGHAYTSAGAVTGGDQDRVICLRRADQHLFGFGAPMTIAATDFDAATRQYKITSGLYIAFTSQRYAASVAVLGGTAYDAGLVIPATAS